MFNGRIYLLFKDKGIKSSKFDEHYFVKSTDYKFYEKINLLKTEEDLLNFIKSLDEKYVSCHRKSYTYRMENLILYDVITKNELIIDFNNKYFERFYSDWLYFKNMTGLIINFILKNKKEVKEAKLKNGEFCVFLLGMNL